MTTLIKINKVYQDEFGNVIGVMYGKKTTGANDMNLSLKHYADMLEDIRQQGLYKEERITTLPKYPNAKNTL